MLKRILLNGARTGAVLTATTTASIMIADTLENGAAWSAVNNVSHIVDGDDKVYSGEFSPRDSSIGLAINATAMGTWAILYEGIFGAVQFPKSLITSALFTSGAYAVDYYIVPDQYTPGIEHKISKRAIFVTYAIMALTLAFSPLWNRRKK
jgi:hypothetical protein